jgi:hypothetical protein
MEGDRQQARGDEWTDRLALLFLEHPAWVEAATHLRPEASSTVYFSHRNGEPWRLEQRDSQTRLLPGGALEPDFVFRFTSDSIERLEAVEGNIGDFAVVLFSLIVDGEVGFRIAAGYPRLIRRGYVGLLRVAGPPVLAFGATHGIRTLRGLARFVARIRSRGPEEWESDPD